MVAFVEILNDTSMSESIDPDSGALPHKTEDLAYEIEVQEYFEQAKKGVDESLNMLIGAIKTCEQEHIKVPVDYLQVWNELTKPPFGVDAAEIPTAETQKQMLTDYKDWNVKRICSKLSITSLTRDAADELTALKERINKVAYNVIRSYSIHPGQRPINSERQNGSDVDSDSK